MVFKLLKKSLLYYDRITAKDPITAGGDKLNAQMSCSKRRLMFVSLVFLGLYTTVIIRVYDLSMPDFFSEQPENTTQHYIKNNNIRANIVDRNGVVMATQLKVSHLIADPKKILDAKDAASKISYVFPNIDKEKLVEYLSNKQSRYHLIKRNVTPTEQQALHNMGIPGISFEVSETRFYPQQSLAAHILGLTDTDMHGIAGVERYFQGYLTTPETKNLQLSIDLRVQYILQRALKNSIDTFNALGGAALVMHIKTGEVLGMVSMPDFNPNNRATMTSETAFNRASVGVYEPGSVMKIINTAIALESNTSKIGTRYDVSKVIGIGHYRIRDFHAYNDSLSVADILRKSSNIGSVKMAEKFGPHVQDYYFRKLGLFSPQNIELSEKSQSLDKKRLSRIRMMTMSYGHGIAVTPLQLASAISTIVNGGYYTRPTILLDSQRKILGDNEKTDNKTNSRTVDKTTLSEWASLWRQNTQQTRKYFKKMKSVDLSDIHPVHGERIFSQKTSDFTRYAMRLVCEPGGSGTRADVYGFPVMGKTGTAEKPSAKGGYNRKSLISSFAGVFPAHKPEYVVYAMVDEPQVNQEISNYVTGGIVAAPIVKEVVEHIAPLLDIKPLNYPKSSHAVSENMLDKRYDNEIQQVRLR